MSFTSGPNTKQNIFLLFHTVIGKLYNVDQQLTYKTINK